MKTFAITLLSAVGIVILIWLTAMSGARSDRAAIGIVLMLASPFIFLAGLIIAIVGKDKVKQIGFGLLISSVLVVLVGFGVCTQS